MRVPFLDLAATHADLRHELDAAITRVIDRGQFILGDEVAAFEVEFARFVGTKHCIGVGNGLDALELTIRALGVGEGGEVIVPANTFIATWLAVDRAGGTVIPVEPIEATYNVDPERVREAISPRTRGIVAVHLYGQPADMTTLHDIADEHGIWLLEDAAQAHGARWAGRRAGSLGDAAAWSFYPAKNLGALGDAGAVTTDSDVVADFVRKLRNYGSAAKYHHDRLGVNSRLDEIQAAVLRVKLPKLEIWNERRAAVARAYVEGLGDTDVRLPVVAPEASPSWHLFVIRNHERDELRRRLAAAGVGTQVHYPVPPHLQAAYGERGLAQGAFPITEAIHREVVSLPMGPELTPDQVAHVIEAVRQR